MSNLPHTDTPTDMPIMAHFAELRLRLIYSMGCVIGVFLLLVGFSRSLYDHLSAPLVTILPAQSHMIATEVASGFLAPIRLTVFIALLISMPFILWQIWQFIAPALYKKEKTLALSLLLSASILFYAGMAFAYFVALVPALKFLILFSPDNVLAMTDIDGYLDFILKLFLVFGLMFEIPIATVLLVWMNVVSAASLAKKRRHIIVGCFGVSAIVTPPDGLSMIILAVMMCLLFETGLLLARALNRRMD